MKRPAESRRCTARAACIAAVAAAWLVAGVIASPLVCSPRNPDGLARSTEEADAASPEGEGESPSAPSSDASAREDTKEAGGCAASSDLREAISLPSASAEEPEPSGPESGQVWRRADSAPYPPQPPEQTASPAPPPVPQTSEAPGPRSPQDPGKAARPGDAEVQLGLEALQRGAFDKAREHFERALTIDPGHPVAHSRMAYLHFNERDFRAAAKQAAKAVRLDPSDSVAGIILGRSREALGEGEKALEAYSAAAAASGGAENPEKLAARALAHYLRAMVRIERGETTNVETDLDEVIRAYPKHGYALYERALHLLKTGRASEAVEAFERASTIAPDFSPQESWLYPNRRYLFLEENLRYWTGVALLQAGRAEEAVRSLEGVIPKVEALAGSTMIKQGSTAAALEGRVETSFFGAHYHAALAYEALNDQSRAKSLVKALFKIDLADEETQRLAKVLQRRLK